MVAGPDVRRINPKYRAMSINFGRRFDANSGCWVDVGCRMLSAGGTDETAVGECRLPDAGCRIPVAGYRLPDAGCRMPDVGCKKPDAGCRGGGAGCRPVVAGLVAGGRWRCRMPI